MSLLVLQDVPFDWHRSTEGLDEGGVCQQVTCVDRVRHCPLQPPPQVSLFVRADLSRLGSHIPGSHGAILECAGFGSSLSVDAACHDQICRGGSNST